jgi:glucose-6-phosphate 1-epimerase
MNKVLDLTELNSRFGISGVARICKGHGGLARIEIDTPLAHGEMYLHGAHVTSWRPADSEEVLFLSTKSRWEEGQAIRGGIPICFPWFRGKADDPHAPAHGFVRTRSWQLYSIVENEAGVAVTVFIENDEQTQRWWPGEFRLLHRVTFGSELKLELICINTGKTQFHFEEALHTYNRVADVKDVCLKGLDGIRFLDNTDANKEKAQAGNLTVASQTDDAFMNTENTVDFARSEDESSNSAAEVEFDLHSRLEPMARRRAPIARLSSYRPRRLDLLQPRRSLRHRAFAPIHGAG